MSLSIEAQLMRRMALGLTVLVIAAVPAAAQDKPESLPPPTPVPLVIVPVVEVGPPRYQQPSRYQVWQNYAVDGTGRFRARVIATPCGAYYYYNGMPYLTPTVRQHNYQPFVTD
jgi:hypothetical protein